MVIFGAGPTPPPDPSRGPVRRSRRSSGQRRHRLGHRRRRLGHLRLGSAHLRRRLGHRRRRLWPPTPRARPPTPRLGRRRRRLGHRRRRLGHLPQRARPPPPRARPPTPRARPPPQRARPWLLRRPRPPAPRARPPTPRARPRPPQARPPPPQAPTPPLQAQPTSAAGSATDAARPATPPPQARPPTPQARQPPPRTRPRLPRPRPIPRSRPLCEAHCREDLGPRAARSRDPRRPEASGAALTRSRPRCASAIPRERRSARPPTRRAPPSGGARPLPGPPRKARAPVSDRSGPSVAYDVLAVREADGGMAFDVDGMRSQVVRPDGTVVPLSDGAVLPSAGSPSRVCSRLDCASSATSTVPALHRGFASAAGECPPDLTYKTHPVDFTYESYLTTPWENVEVVRRAKRVQGRGWAIFGAVLFATPPAGSAAPPSSPSSTSPHQNSRAPRTSAWKPSLLYTWEQPSLPCMARPWSCPTASRYSSPRPPPDEDQMLPPAPHRDEGHLAQAPQREMAIIVRGRFFLRQTPAFSRRSGSSWSRARSPRRGFAEGDGERTGRALLPGRLRGLPARHGGDGARHVPRAGHGKPVAECPVRVSVGKWSKTLQVIGRRVWTERKSGPAISDPAPFVKMPLGWAKARSA